MEKKEYAENCTTIGLIILIIGQTLRHSTQWTYAPWLEWAGIGLIYLCIIYRMAHFNEYKGMNIVTLVMHGLVLLIVLLLLIFK